MCRVRLYVGALQWKAEWRQEHAEVCSFDQCCLAAAVDESGERGPLEWCRLSVGRRQAWCAYCFTSLLSGGLIYSLLVRTTGLLLGLSHWLACSFAAVRMKFGVFGPVFTRVRAGLPVLWLAACVGGSRPLVGGSLVEGRAVESAIVVLLWETARCIVVSSGSVPTVVCSTNRFRVKHVIKFWSPCKWTFISYISSQFIIVLHTTLYFQVSTMQVHAAILRWVLVSQWHQHKKWSPILYPGESFWRKKRQ
jgi:hypothetical protein